MGLPGACFPRQLRHPDVITTTCRLKPLPGPPQPPSPAHQAGSTPCGAPHHLLPSRCPHQPLHLRKPVFTSVPPPGVSPLWPHPSPAGCPSLESLTSASPGPFGCHAAFPSRVSFPRASTFRARLSCVPVSWRQRFTSRDTPPQPLPSSDTTVTQSGLCGSQDALTATPTHRVPRPLCSQATGLTWAPPLSSQAQQPSDHASLLAPPSHRALFCPQGHAPSPQSTPLSPQAPPLSSQP